MEDTPPNPRKEDVPSLQGKPGILEYQILPESQHLSQPIPQIGANQASIDEEDLLERLSLKATLSSKQKIKSPNPRRTRKEFGDPVKNTHGVTSIKS